MSWLTVPPVFDRGLRSPSGPVKAFVRRCLDKVRSRPIGTDQSPSSRICAAPRPKDGAACVHVDQPLRAFKGSNGPLRRSKDHHSSRPATPNVPAPWRGFRLGPAGLGQERGQSRWVQARSGRRREVAQVGGGEDGGEGAGGRGSPLRQGLGSAREQPRPRF